MRISPSPSESSSHYQVNGYDGWLAKKNYLLFGFGLAVQVLMVWIFAEAILIWKKARRYLPSAGSEKS